MNKKDRKHLKRLEVFVERLLVTLYVTIVLFLLLILWLVYEGSLKL